MQFPRPAIYLLACSFTLGVCFTAYTSTASSIPDGQSEDNLHKRVTIQLEMLRDSKNVLAPALPGFHPKRVTANAEAPIPPQCYTDTRGKHNPCYVCHQEKRTDRENVIDDGGLQLEYAFSDVGMTNHWKNLFKDRSKEVAKITDEEILKWINTDNYSALASRLKTKEFKGWTPDLKNLQLGVEAFDDQGFAKDGSQWVAFNYKPLPSTFWPTNGSTDDVMIRLAKPFRTNSDGKYSRDIYKANLAIVEARIKGRAEITSLPINEKNIGVDLDKDGALGTATKVSRTKNYVGEAKDYFIDDYLYPEGTEFLHTVRYVGISDTNEIVVPPRMKEVRYMKKWRGYSKPVYARQYELENFGKEAGRLPRYSLLGDLGLDNSFGWSLQGFIEDSHGELRTLTYEENLFCMGCHTSVGSTIDKTFSFARKVDGGSGWSYINLKGMPDAPNIGESKGEIATYLERVGGGGEFRSNPEMHARWFNADDSLNHKAIASAKDVYELITPSPERALELNKAYRVIVKNQNYIYGRDATVTPPANVYDFIDNKTAPTLPQDKYVKWDIRLDWPD